MGLYSEDLIIGENFVSSTERLIFLQPLIQEGGIYFSSLWLAKNDLKS